VGYTDTVCDGSRVEVLCSSHPPPSVLYYLLSNTSSFSFHAAQIASISFEEWACRPHASITRRDQPNLLVLYVHDSPPCGVRFDVGDPRTWKGSDHKSGRGHQSHSWQDTDTPRSLVYDPALSKQPWKKLMPLIDQVKIQRHQQQSASTVRAASFVSQSGLCMSKSWCVE